MNDNTDLGHDTDDSAALRKLRADLRSLPRVSAPLDFEQHLRQRIEVETAKKKLPLWRKILPGLSGESWRVPAFAYGGVSTILVIAFSVYMVRVTDIEQTIDTETGRTHDAVPTELQDAPLELRSETEHAPEDRKHEAKVSSETRPIDEPTTTGEQRTVPGQSTSPSKRQKSVPAASSEHEERAEEDAAHFAPRTRGILQMDLTGRADSAAIADSLRTLDSLRSLRLRKMSDPLRDATQ